MKKFLSSLIAVAVLLVSNVSAQSVPTSSVGTTATSGGGGSTQVGPRSLALPTNGVFRPDTNHVFTKESVASDLAMFQSVGAYKSWAVRRVGFLELEVTSDGMVDGGRGWGWPYQSPVPVYRGNGGHSRQR
jgi:hypothetical protein